MENWVDLGEPDTGHINAVVEHGVMEGRPARVLWRSESVPHPRAVPP